MNPVAHVLGKSVLYSSEQIMALYIVYKPEVGQMISAINSQVLVKLHLGSETVEIREVINKTTSRV